MLKFGFCFFFLIQIIEEILSVLVEKNQDIIAGKLAWSYC